jgi:3-oxoacyl-[acyl-carrier-protein] synthase III
LIYPDDRATFCLFGDGGAVSIIAPAPDGTGIIDIRCGTSGRHGDRFMVPAGGARIPRSAQTALVQRDRGGNQRTAEHITMDGVGVLSFFNSVVPDEVRRILAENGLAADDVDWFIFHQASRVALQSIRRALGVPNEKVIELLAEVGNLVSASIPVTIERAQADGRIQPGQLLLLCGFGVGLSWGTALVRV